MKPGSSLSIWFFVGVSLLVNGGFIFGVGIYELLNPPQVQVVLHQLHANIWWGALLFVTGIIYCYHFAPGRKDEQKP
jgi:hypothetical protein